MLSAGKPASSALRRPARGRALRAQADSAGVLDKYPVEQTADDEPFQRVVGELAAALDALADEAHVIRDVEDPVEHADPIPGAFSVWLARITVLRKPRLNQVMMRLDSGRSMSQNRITRVTSVLFSYRTMNFGARRFSSMAGKSALPPKAGALGYCP